jgi:hypothetical protein
MKNKRRGEQGISSYELFIGGLSVLSILNLVLLVLPISGQAKQLILIVDVALTAIFLSDFTVRFASAPAKSRYFFRGGGWLDLIGSLPTLRIFRLFRVLRVSRLLRRYGLRNVIRELVRDPAQGGLLLMSYRIVMSTTRPTLTPSELRTGCPRLRLRNTGGAVRISRFELRYANVPGRSVSR